MIRKADMLSDKRNERKFKTKTSSALQLKA